MCPAELESVDPDELALTLSRLSWAQLDALFEAAEVVLLDEVSESGMFPYLMSQLGRLPQPDLHRIQASLDSPGIQTVDDAPQFCVFISHSSHQRALAGELSIALAALAIDAFVAHDAIEFDQEWLAVIVERLNSCDALLAIVTAEFASSTWCDQEVGWALGRGIQVMSINAGKAPYGFFGSRQALPYRDNAKDVATRVAERLLMSEATGLQMTDALVSRLEHVSTYDGASRLIELLGGSAYWSESLLRRATRAIAFNDQVAHADWGQAKTRLRATLSAAASAGSG